MKKEFKPISMKCNQEQFDAVKPKLKDYNYEIVCMHDFERCRYLINNLGGDTRQISNVLNEDKKSYNRIVYEAWNEKVFLEACGIETTPTLEEVKEMFKEAEEVVSVQGTKFKNKASYWDSLYFDTYQGIESAYIKDGSFEVWNDRKGYAKILTYKEPKEESFTITREQIRLIEHQSVNEDFAQVSRDMREWFPSCFEPEKKELVVGKWYKDNRGCIVNFQGDIKGYGFTKTNNAWYNSECWGLDNDKLDWQEATQQEVEKALKAEAVRRYKVGDCVKSFFHKGNPVLKIKEKDFNINAQGGVNCTGTNHYMPVVYENGNWAEIIQPKKMTQAEIEKELGYNIEIVK